MRPARAWRVSEDHYCDAAPTGLLCRTTGESAQTVNTAQHQWHHWLCRRRPTHDPRNGNPLGRTVETCASSRCFTVSEAQKMVIGYLTGRFSSVAEHLFRKLKVLSSILRAGRVLFRPDSTFCCCLCFCFCFCYTATTQQRTQANHPPVTQTSLRSLNLSSRCLLQACALLQAEGLHVPASHSTSHCISCAQYWHAQFAVPKPQVMQSSKLGLIEPYAHAFSVCKRRQVLCQSAVGKDWL